MYKEFKRIVSLLNPLVNQKVSLLVQRSIKSSYEEKHRYYHNMDHVETCLETFKDFENLCSNADAVIFALIYHDLVYTPGSTINEQASADRAGFDISYLGLSTTFRDRVKQLILQTTHSTSGTTIDDKIIMDVDMSILAKEKNEYLDYESDILKEYSPIFSEEEFISGRLSFLTDLLMKSTIYQTQYGFDRYEAKARANIQKTIVCYKAGDISLTTWGN